MIQSIQNNFYSMLILLLLQLLFILVIATVYLPMIQRYLEAYKCKLKEFITLIIINFQKIKGVVIEKIQKYFPKYFIPSRFGISFFLYLDSLIFGTISLLLFKVLFYLFFGFLSPFWLNFFIYILGFFFNLGFMWSYYIKLYVAKLVRLGLGYDFCNFINKDDIYLYDPHSEDYEFVDRCYYNNFFITFLYDHKLLKLFNKFFQILLTCLLIIRLELLYNRIINICVQSYIFYLLLSNALPILIYIITLILIIVRIIATLFHSNFAKFIIAINYTKNNVATNYKNAHLLLKWIICGFYVLDDLTFMKEKIIFPPIHKYYGVSNNNINFVSPNEYVLEELTESIEWPLHFCNYTNSQALARPVLVERMDRLVLLEENKGNPQHYYISYFLLFIFIIYEKFT